MPFVLVFNIIVCVCLAIGLVVILGSLLLLKDAEKQQGENAERRALLIRKVRGITYIVIFSIMIITMIVNLIV